MKDLKNFRYIWCIPIMPILILMLIVSLMLLWIGRGFVIVGDFMRRVAYELDRGEIGDMYTYRNRFILWYRRPIDKFIAKREAKKNEMP